MTGKEKSAWPIVANGSYALNYKVAGVVWEFAAI
jgi:hypothetical protein